MSRLLQDIVEITASSLLGGLISSGLTQLFRLISERFWRRHMPDAKPRSPSLSGILPSTLVGVVIFGLAAYALIIPNPVLGSCPLFASTNASITSPSDGAVVSQVVIVEGTACHIPQDKELWVLVAAAGVPGYFPQTGPILVSSNDNKWSASAQLGGANTLDTGKDFVLYTALADQTGSAAINGYFANAPDFKPLNPLPAGMQLLNQIQVVRE
jgi:hypothetical protein